jgi:hypothetical protein
VIEGAEAWLRFFEAHPDLSGALAFTGVILFFTLVERFSR